MESEYENVHGAAYIELARRFGGIFKTRWFMINGGGLGSPIRVLAADPERVYVLFSHAGAANIGLGPTPAAAIAPAYTLSVATSRDFNLNEHAVLPTEEWFINAQAVDGVGILTVTREARLKRK